MKMNNKPYDQLEREALIKYALTSEGTIEERARGLVDVLQLEQGLCGLDDRERGKGTVDSYCQVILDKIYASEQNTTEESEEPGLTVEDLTEKLDYLVKQFESSLPPIYSIVTDIVHENGLIWFDREYSGKIFDQYFSGVEDVGFFMDRNSETITIGLGNSDSKILTKSEFPQKSGETYGFQIHITRKKRRVFKDLYKLKIDYTTPHKTYTGKTLSHFISSLGEELNSHTSDNLQVIGHCTNLMRLPQILEDFTRITRKKRSKNKLKYLELLQTVLE